MTVEENVIHTDADDLIASLKAEVKNQIVEALINDATCHDSDDIDDDDIYYDEDEDCRMHVGEADLFLTKLFANFMGEYKPVHAYDMIVREMASRMKDNPFHKPWIDEYSARFNEYSKARPAEKFILPREVFSQNEILTWAREAQERIGSDEFPISNSAKLLADLLELNKVETLFLQLAIKLSASLSYNYHQMFEQFRYTDFGEGPASFYAELFGVSEQQISTAMKGFLFQSGLLSQQDTRHKPFFYINTEMRDAFTAPNLSIESLTQELFPSNLSTELTINDFAHMATEVERCERTLLNGLASRKRGINVMFWGEPGTGKTELALLIAKRNNLNLRVIGDSSDADSQEKGRAERLVSLKIAQKLYGRDPNTILLFDEMEDLYKSDTYAQFSKAFVNRVIENTIVPIIWTTNDLDCCDQAQLRRMLWNIPFEVPNAVARRPMWRRHTDRYSLGLTDKTIDDLAETYDISPALIHNAAHVASMAGLSSAEIPEVVRTLDRLVQFGVKRTFNESPRQDEFYDLSCANTDTDLTLLVDRLCKARPNFKLLLWGEPGTGKTEFGRHVAYRLGRRFITKNASDILSMFVGGCERAIKEVFEQAKDEKAVLLMDEFDTFIRDRTLASRDYEITRVNEMLAQIQKHEYPFIATTNMMDTLDPAAVSRFTFKMKFNFLRPDQTEKLFRSYFEAEPPASLSRVHNLAPRDFANVRNKAFIMNVAEPKAIFEMLEEECSIKPQRSMKIGF